MNVLGDRGVRIQSWDILGPSADAIATDLGKGRVGCRSWDTIGSCDATIETGLGTEEPATGAGMSSAPVPVPATGLEAGESSMEAPTLQTTVTQQRSQLGEPGTFSAPVPLP